MGLACDGVTMDAMLDQGERYDVKSMDRFVSVLFGW